MIRLGLLVLLVVSGLACGGHKPAPQVPGELRPAVGLYVVTERQASNPLDLPEKWWEETQYIELVYGQYFEVPADQLALVYWSAESLESAQYTFSANQLSGHLEGSRFLMSEGKLGRSWLVLDNNGLVAELHDIRYKSDVDHEEAVRVALKLKRVERTADIDKRLVHPSEND